MAMNLKKAKPKTATKAKIEVPADDGKTSEIKSAIAEVVTQHKDGAKTVEQEEIAVASGAGPMANVGVRASRTFNMGDYNSVKIEVSLNVPCPVDENEIEQTYVFAAGWVDQKMNEKGDEIEKALAEAGAASE